MVANALYANKELVTKLTKKVIASGDTVFQIEWLAETQEKHVDLLLEFFRPVPNALILDAGCGVGGVEALAGRTRPDLSFVLLNYSAEQLALSLVKPMRVAGDMNAIPLRAESVDATMVCHALGHADWKKFLAEAARVTRPGGWLYVYDIFGMSEFVKRVLMYDTQPLDEFVAAASEHWRVAELVKPQRLYREHFNSKLDSAVSAQMFREVSSVLIRLERK